MYFYLCTFLFIVPLYLSMCLAGFRPAVVVVVVVVAPDLAPVYFIGQFFVACILLAVVFLCFISVLVSLYIVDHVEINQAIKNNSVFLL